MSNVRPIVRSWERSLGGDEPWPLFATLLLLPLFVLWTLPQTLGGVALAMHARARGHRGDLYRFGPFLFYVVRAAPPASRGISLGAVILAEDPSILTHEMCHAFTALWLSWAYLPVYGLEYLLVGHARSPHERLTNRLERSCRYAWRRALG